MTISLFAAGSSEKLEEKKQEENNENIINSLSEMVIDCSSSE